MENVFPQLTQNIKHQNNYHSRRNVHTATHSLAFASTACVCLIEYRQSSLSANTKSFACSEQQSILLKMRTRKNVAGILLARLFLSIPSCWSTFFPNNQRSVNDSLIGRMPDSYQMMGKDLCNGHEVEIYGIYALP